MDSFGFPAYRRGKVRPHLGFILLLLLPLPLFGAPCDPPITNPILCENTKPGNPSSEWDVSGSGDPSIQGFATDISVNHGATVRFKVDTDATDYRIDIYRLGYYGGMGARKVATVQPSAALPQVQPACLNDSATGLVDCGNWAESASWAVPADAVSGIYIARLVREDAVGRREHMRLHRPRRRRALSDPASRRPTRPGRPTTSTAATASTSAAREPPRARLQGQLQPAVHDARRPRTRTGSSTPSTRWSAGSSQRLQRQLLHRRRQRPARAARSSSTRSFLSVGHDEYWSGGAARQRRGRARRRACTSRSSAATRSSGRRAGKPSIDGSATPHRTLVSYKETHAGAKIDPRPDVWTGTWRDNRASARRRRRTPENALTGKIFTVNWCSDRDPGPGRPTARCASGATRRVATLAAGQTATLPERHARLRVGRGPRQRLRGPPGLVRLSSTTVNGVPQRLLDNGSTYGPGTATHNLTLYRHASGALVFGAGTVQWSWGLDGKHDRGSDAPDARMQQATVNLFADMGVQPATLQAGLVAATASTDTTPPSSPITAPTAGATVPSGSAVTITGTATDSAAAWSAASRSRPTAARRGTAPTAAQLDVRVDAGGAGRHTIREPRGRRQRQPRDAGAGITVTVAASGGLPVHDLERLDTPADVERPTTARSSSASSSGPTRRATSPASASTRAPATRARTSVTSGRPAARCSRPRPSRARARPAGRRPLRRPGRDLREHDLRRVVLTRRGHYAFSGNYFATGVDKPPLHALADGTDGGNGVYQYGPSGVPDRDVQAGELLGRRRLRHRRRPDTTPPS